MNRYLVLALLMSFAVVAIISCSQSPDEAKPPATKVDKQVDDTLVKENGPEDVPYKGGKDDVKTLVQGNNEFAFDLYQRLSHEKGNVVFSPYSISNALAMTYGGARGKTADEMAKTMHFRLPQQRLHPAFGELMQQLQPKGPNLTYRLEVANALWPQKDWPVRKEFEQLVGTHYGAGVRPVNFRNDPDAALQAINRWVAERTNDKIKKFLTREDVTPQTRLILTNTAYFKAGWSYPFPANQTKPEDFAVASDKTVKVSMMHLNDVELNYYVGEEFQVLELPYDGDRLSLVIFLPAKKGRLAELEKGLTASKVEATLSRLTPLRGNVALPRFKIDFRRSLVDDLKALGMSLSCAPDADFSGMVSDKSFHISRVIHQAMISVDEEGTEAAAATAVIGRMSESRPFSFRADHPFLFLLRERQTKSILFLGRVTDGQR